MTHLVDSHIFKAVQYLALWPEQPFDQLLWLVNMLLPVVMNVVNISNVTSQYNALKLVLCLLKDCSFRKSCRELLNLHNSLTDLVCIPLATHSVTHNEEDDEGEHGRHDNPSNDDHDGPTEEL